MIPNGIYVRCSPDFLVSELSENMQELKRIGSIDDLPADSSGSVRGVVIFINGRGDGWCHLQITGDQDGIGPAARFLTRHKSLEKVLVWDCNQKLMEYNYSYFERGKLLEQLIVKGPALEAVSFVSELRQVELQELIRGKDFAEKAFKRFGLRSETGLYEEHERIRLDFSLLPKRSFLKSLLGTLAGGE
jgi:hypothetical protein